MKTVFQIISKNRRDALFFLCIILNASVVFDLRYFPTQDSGAHAYNSNILYNLLFGDKASFSAFFSINPELVPNLTSHVIMMLFNAFLPFSAAEKLTLFIYFLLFPFLFKRMVSKFNDNKTYLIFLIFPFSHFCVLYYGFYNFAYGLLFFFMGIAYWVGHRKEFKPKQIVLFFIILILCYFSHLVAFISLVMFCGIYEVFDLILQLKGRTTIEVLKEKMILCSKATVSFIFPLTLTFLYFKKRPSLGLEYFMPVDDLNNILLKGDIFKSYDISEEAYTKPLFYLLVILFLYSWIYKIYHFIKQEKKVKFFEVTDMFFFLALVFFYLFYTQPNSDGYGGYINIRLALLANLMLFTWACVTIKRDPKFEVLVLIISLFLSYRIVQGKKNAITWLSEQFKSFEGAMEKVQDGDIVAPVFIAENFNWLGGHFSNYLGADKKVIILDNYEASSGYFPIVWNDPGMPQLIAGTPTSEEHVLAFSNRLVNYPFGTIKYVLVYGDRTDNALCNLLISEIKKNYTLEYKDKQVLLYKKNP